MTNNKAVILTNGALMTVISTGLDTVIYVYNSLADTDRLQVSIFKNVSPLYGGSNEICVNTTTQFSDSVSAGTWSSANTNVATVGSTGIVQPLTSGTVIISFTAPNAACTYTATATTIVIDTFPYPISYSNDSACARPIGSILAFFVDTPYRDGTSSWSSSNNAIAVVGTGGIVQGISQGTALISYNLTNSCGANAATQVINVSIPAQPTTGPRVVNINSNGSYANIATGGYWFLYDSTYASINNATGILTTTNTPTTVIVLYADTNYCGPSFDTVSVSIISNYLPGVQRVFDSTVFAQLNEHGKSVFIDPINPHSIFADQNTGRSTFIDQTNGFSAFVDQQDYISVFVDQTTFSSVFVDQINGKSAFQDQITAQGVFVNIDGSSAIKQPFIRHFAVTLAVPFTYPAGSVIIGGTDGSILEPLTAFSGLDPYSILAIGQNSYTGITNYTITTQTSGGTVITTFSGFLLILEFQ